MTLSHMQFNAMVQFFGQNHAAPHVRAFESQRYEANMTEHFLELVIALGGTESKYVEVGVGCGPNTWRAATARSTRQAEPEPG